MGAGGGVPECGSRYICIAEEEFPHMKITGKDWGGQKRDIWHSIAGCIWQGTNNNQEMTRKKKTFEYTEFY